MWLFPLSVYFVAKISVTRHPAGHPDNIIVNLTPLSLRRRTRRARRPRSARRARRAQVLHNNMRPPTIQHKLQQRHLGQKPSEKQQANAKGPTASAKLQEINGRLVWRTAKQRYFSKRRSGAMSHAMRFQNNAARCAPRSCHCGSHPIRCDRNQAPIANVFSNCRSHAYHCEHRCLNPKSPVRIGSNA